MNASLSPKTTPTKVSRNSDAVNGEPGAEETESEIEAEEKKEEIEETGKSRNYQPSIRVISYLKCRRLGSRGQKQYLKTQISTTKCISA